MFVLRPTKSVHLLLHCSLIPRRACSTTPVYSHLAQTVFQSHAVPRGVWRDNAQQHAKIGSVAEAIAKVAEENMKLLKSDTSFLATQGGYLPASQWPAILPARLRIFWQPTNDVDLVLPKECEPSDKEMARYQTFLSPEKDRDFFMTPSAWLFANTYEDGVASTVARALYRLLKSISEKEDIEDKVEAYTGDFFSSLRDYMNIENLLTKNFNILRSQNIVGTIFGNKYNAKPEYVLEDHVGAFQAFVEKGGDTSSAQYKRLKDSPDMFAKSISQKMAEALAIATHRFVDPQSADASQEVFGIGIRHYYFTFWHAVFSREYLGSMISGQHKWQGNEHVIFKSYPYSQFGLDFCDPVQRKYILRYIHRILNYLEI